MPLRVPPGLQVQRAATLPARLDDLAAMSEDDLVAVTNGARSMADLENLRAIDLDQQRSDGVLVDSSRSRFGEEKMRRFREYEAAKPLSAAESAFFATKGFYPSSYLTGWFVYMLNKRSVPSLASPLCVGLRVKTLDHTLEWARAHFMEDVGCKAAFVASKQWARSFWGPVAAAYNKEKKLPKYVLQHGSVFKRERQVSDRAYERAMRA